MTDKKIIKQQQEKIERIEQLQDELHKLAITGLIAVKILELPDELEISLNAIHDVSHTIKDVLDGMSPREAIKKNMTEEDEE